MPSYISSKGPFKHQLVGSSVDFLQVQLQRSTCYQYKLLALIGKAKAVDDHHSSRLSQHQVSIAAWLAFSRLAQKKTYDFSSLFQTQISEYKMRLPPTAFLPPICTKPSRIIHHPSHSSPPSHPETPCDTTIVAPPNHPQSRTRPLVLNHISTSRWGLPMPAA